MAGPGSRPSWTAVARNAFLRRCAECKIHGPADISDAAVSQIGEAFQCFRDAMFIIDDDVADALVHPAQVEVNCRDALSGQHFDHRRIDLRSQDGNSRNLQCQ